MPFLLPGDVVKVRSWPEIRCVLNKNGQTDGLPFMPEMLQYCGTYFTVTKRLERTCEETEGGMRRICNTVFLDTVRCHGSAHGGCQKECFIFWKEASLQKVDCPSGKEVNRADTTEGLFPYKYSTPDGEYICQSTEMIRATSPLSPIDIGCLVRDIRAKTYTPGKLISVIFYAAFLRLRRLVTGRSYRVLEGGQKKTPAGSLGLRPG